MRGKRRFWLDFLIVAAVIVLGIPLLKAGYQHYLEVSYPLEYDEIVTTYAQEYDLAPSLIYGIIYTESRFDPEAVSSVGAKGLMQLMDETFDWTLQKLGEESGNVFDPETNIRCGARLLKYLSAQFNNTEAVLAAYNAGVGNVKKWLKDTRYSDDGETLHTIPFPETEEYVQRVLKIQKIYQTLYKLS